MTKPNNLELLKSINDQVRKEWSVPANCNNDDVLFNVIKETLTRYTKLTVEKVTKDDC